MCSNKFVRSVLGIAALGAFASVSAVNISTVDIKCPAAIQVKCLQEPDTDPDDISTQYQCEYPVLSPVSAIRSYSSESGIPTHLPLQVLSTGNGKIYKSNYYYTSATGEEKLALSQTPQLINQNGHFVQCIYNGTVTLMTTDTVDVKQMGQLDPTTCTFPSSTEVTCSLSQ